MNLASSFRYAGSPARVYAGDGVLSQLGVEAGRAGARRVFVLCGQSVAHKTDLLERTRQALGELYAGVFDAVEAESPVPSVEAAAGAARSAGADLILAVGGGSAVVTARATLILLAEGGDVRELCTQYPPGRSPVSPRLMKPKLPNMVVLTTPTTATTRSGAAILDPVRRHRLELFDPKTRPVAVFLDGAALRTAPQGLFLSTSTTTFCSVVGALQSPGLNAFGYADLRQAFEVLRQYMPLVGAGSDDADTRIQLSVGALLANRASDAGSGGGGGISSGIAHQLQTRYDHVGQGAAAAVLAPAGMRFNRAVLEAGQARVAEAFGLVRPGMSTVEAAGLAPAAVAGFLTSLGVPARLRDLGVPESDLHAIAEDAMEDFFLRNNPRRVRDASEVLEVLRQAW